MNYRLLEDKHIEMRREQMRQHGREFTEIDLNVSKVIFNTALQAIEKVNAGIHDTCMQAVSLSTGLGKSTSAYALIAAFAKHNPSFSAAYVVPTIKMAEEAQEGIERLLGGDTTKLWSSLHRHKGVDRTKAVEMLGHVPLRLVNKAELPTTRIIIVTHGQLMHELRTKRDEGTLTYMGNPRSVVFIDEDPDWVETVSSKAAELQWFHDQLVKRNPDHHWLPIVSDVVHRMSAITRSSGQTYIPPSLLTIEEGKAFEDDAGLSLWDETNEDDSEEVRFCELKRMRDAVEFLEAASRGNAFYSRYDASFFAYKLYFDNDYPGFVLLDATSDIAGLICLHPGVKMVDVPQVNYENLELFHMTMPSKFKKIREVTKKRIIGREYGDFIKQSVLSNSPEGAQVLVVVHKDVLTQELIDVSEDPNAPLDWEGRLVNTQNWGAGVGLNKFKHKTHVFLFGEFYKPRFATIGQTHAWSQKPLTEELLRLAEGKRKAADLYVPQGDYLQVHEGHLLRWAKQLAMRGTARQVDGDGRCAHMKLFTTMDLERLIPNIERLFPGANHPVSAALPEGSQEPALRGRDGLVKLLLNTKHNPILGADEIEVVTGLASRNLSREYDAIKDYAVPLGWSLKSAPELKRNGRMKYLVHDARLLALSMT